MRPAWRDGRAVGKRLSAAAATPGRRCRTPSRRRPSCTARRRSPVSLNRVQVRPPSRVRSLPLGPTATAVRGAPDTQLDTRAVAAEVAAVGPGPAAVAGVRRGVGAVVGRGEVAADRDPLRGLRNASENTPPASAAGIVESATRPGVARGRGEWKTRAAAAAGGQPDVAAARGDQAGAAGREAELAVDRGAASRRVDQLPGARRASWVSMIRNFPSTGSLTATPWRPPGQNAMQS